MCPAKALGPPPARASGRGIAGAPPAECTKPPVPVHQGTPPLGRKCVLCQASNLPPLPRPHARCSCTVLFVAARPGGSAQGRKRSSKPILHFAESLESRPTWPSHRCLLNSPLLIRSIPVLNFAPPCRSPYNLRAAHIDGSDFYCTCQYLYCASQFTK